MRNLSVLPLHIAVAHSLFHIPFVLHILCLPLALFVAGSFNAVDLADLEIASHFVKYAVASYAIIPVTENPDKK